jgi:hypothetical protein
MVLNDRQAADMRANEALEEAHQTLKRFLHANGGNLALAFRNGLRKAERDLSARLIELYSQLNSVSDHQSRDELVTVITRHVTSFIASAKASQRGAHAASAAREAEDLGTAVRKKIPNAFDLAVHDWAKKRPGTESNINKNAGVDGPLLLFLSANPDPASPLNVEKEQNRITKVRDGSKHQSKVRIESLPDLDLPAFAKSLRLHAPTILHFSGHGEADGSLVMRDENGTSQEMSPKGVAKLVALQKSTIRLVVLNACFSSELADLLVADIDCVIGMTDEVSDDAAILFAQTFYSALFDGETVESAFATSSAVVGARYQDESDIPSLKTRVDVGADKLRLVS